MHELIAALYAQAQSVFKTARKCPDPETTSELEFIGAELRILVKGLSNWCCARAGVRWIGSERCTGI